MKRILRVTGRLLAVLLLLVPVSAAVGNAANAHPQGRSITIQAWVHGYNSLTGLSATIEASFKLKGAFVDQGGNPTWTDSTYLAGTTAKDFAAKSGNWQPVAGVLMVPPVKGGAFLTAYAVWHLVGQKGEIFLQAAGTYDPKMQGRGTWVITGGTDTYRGVMGQGTFTADASPLLRGVAYHAITMTGQVWRLST